GEVSLAHNGVLFLDELPEFRRAALEALRQPLEDGHVFIARANARASFPARPLLVGAMNPCPCGYALAGHPRQVCQCSAGDLARYKRKLSGPLLDRLDVHTPLAAVDLRALSRGGDSESTATVRARVVAARQCQLDRWRAGVTSRRTNAELPLNELETISALDGESRRLLEDAAAQLGLSARAFVKVLRVARTVADLDAEAKVRAPHISQAIQGRVVDRRAARNAVSALLS
ncbi:MAG: ATP-binding protein, partial [Deltaproteobacteria bacterium]